MALPLASPVPVPTAWLAVKVLKVMVEVAPSRLPIAALTASRLGVARCGRAA
jgi:hypothetical protein